MKKTWQRPEEAGRDLKRVARDLEAGRALKKLKKLKKPEEADIGLSHGLHPASSGR